METSSKVYIVSIYGGEYEDRYEYPIGVCSSFELASKLKDERLARKNECSISSEEFEDMLDYMYKYEDANDIVFDTEEEGLLKLFPDKDPKQIEIACEQHYSIDDFGGINIQEIDFYN